MRFDRNRLKCRRAQGVVQTVYGPELTYADDASFYRSTKMIGSETHRLSLEQLLQAMPEPLGEILIRTYGLFDSDKQPLEAVAEKLALSLNEAEKFRMKAIRRLRDPRLDFLASWTQEALNEESATTPSGGGS